MFVKINKIIFSFILIISVLSTYGQEIVPKDGDVKIESDGTKSKYIPVAGAAEYNYSQFIYLKDEIKKSGRIKSITFFIKKKHLKEKEDRSTWKVSLKETNRTHYNGDEFADVETSSRKDKNYNINQLKYYYHKKINTGDKNIKEVSEVFKKAFEQNQDNDEIIVDFEKTENKNAKPFEYHNTKNLVVEIWDNDVAYEGFKLFFKTKQTNTKRTIFSIGEGDTSNHHETSPVNADKNNYQTELGTNYIPAVKFSFAPYIMKFPEDRECQEISENIIIKNDEVKAQDYTQIFWSHNGEGTITNGNTLTPTYQPSPEDNGKEITITLTIGDDKYTPKTQTPFNFHSKSFKIKFKKEIFAGQDGEITIFKGSPEPTEDELFEALGNNVTPNGNWEHNGDKHTYIVKNCKETKHATITVKKISVPTVKNIETCPQEAINIEATAEGGSYTEVKWIKDKGDGTLENDTTLTPIYKPTKNDEGETVILTLTIKLILNNGKEISTSKKVNISIKKSVKISAGEDGELEVQEGQPITNNLLFSTLKGNPTTGGEWKKSTNDNDYIYTVTPKESECGTSKSATIKVKTLHPEIENFKEGTKICSKDEFPIEAKAKNYTKINWNIKKGNGVLENKNSLHPIYKPTNTDNEVILEVTISNDYNASVTKEYKIEVTESIKVTSGEDKTLEIYENEEVTEEKLSKILDKNVTIGGDFIKKDETTYIYEVSSECGGKDEATIKIVTLKLPKIVTFLEDKEICQQNTFQIKNDEVKISPKNLNIKWTTNGQGELIGETSLTPSYKPKADEKEIELTLTITDKNGKTDHKSFKIFVKDMVEISAGEDGELKIQKGQSISDELLFSALKGNPTKGGKWTPNGNEYTYTVTSNSECGNATKTAKIVIREISPEITNFPKDIEICSKEDFKITENIISAKNFTKIKWEHNGVGKLENNTTLTPTYKPNKADKNVKITLTISNDFGEYTSKYFTIKVVEAIKVNAGQDKTLEIYEDDIITDSVLFKALDENANTNGSFDKIDNSTYIYKVTSNCGGKDEATIKIVRLKQPKIEIFPNDKNICQNSSIEIQDNEVKISPKNLTIKWTTNGKGELKNENTLNPIYIPNTDEKEIELTLTITDKNGKTDHKSFKIFVKDMVEISAGEDGELEIQKGQPISDELLFSALKGNPTKGGKWTLNGNEYTYTVTSNSECGNATKTAKIVIREISPEITNFPKDIEICSKEDFKITENIINAKNFTKIKWEHNGVGKLENNTTLTPTYKPNKADKNVKITLTISNDFEKSTTKTFTINVVASIEVNAGGDKTIEIYENEEITESKLFQVLDKNATTNGSFDKVDNSTYIYKVISECGGKDEATIKIVTVKNPKIVTFLEDKEICQQNTFQIKSDEVKISPENLNIKWTTNGQGELIGENSLTPSYKPKADEKEIELTLTITDKNGKTDHKSFKIFVKDMVEISAGEDGELEIQKGQPISDELLFSALKGNPTKGGKWTLNGNEYTYTVSSECGNTATSIVTIIKKKDEETTDINSIKLNNGFSPNKDGKNDLWIIIRNVLEKYPNNSLKVFNRHGNLVYEASPYKNDWNGTYKDAEEPLPIGAYLYIFKTGTGKKYTDWVYINY